jgi:hypothetical protein
LIPRAAFFISDLPFMAFVRNRMSSQQQDLSDVNLFRGGLSFVRVAEGQLAAFRVDRLAISHGLDHGQMGRTNQFIRMFS